MGKKGDRGAKDKSAATNLEEEGKNAAKKPEHGEEEYQCTGILEQDFNELCSRAGFTKIPKVTVRMHPSISNLFPPEESNMLAEKEVLASLISIQSKYAYFQPRILTELEHDDPKSVREIFLRGWKIEEKMLGVFSKCLPALANLQAIHLWKVGLTDLTLLSLLAILPNCPTLRTLTLEGNPLAEGSFYKLIEEESTLAHLSLRNNNIDDAHAKLIGQALSSLTSCNKSLVSLNLSFNHITDLGAGYLAEPPRHAEAKSSDRPSSLVSSTTIDKLQSAKLSKSASKKKDLLKKEEKAQVGIASAGGAVSSSAVAPAKKEDAKQAKKLVSTPEQKVVRGKGIKVSAKEKRSLLPEVEVREPWPARDTVLGVSSGAADTRPLPVARGPARAAARLEVQDSPGPRARIGSWSLAGVTPLVQPPSCGGTHGASLPLLSSWAQSHPRGS
nr:leucine-rich repeat-containing protein 71 isoform X1 [Pelodiscus sinensis]|eukprot:XP_025035891.1 leucine-rich repeat-containing protein 71 isoform X1 [Pelodiscus sinensis]